MTDFNPSDEASAAPEAFRTTGWTRVLQARGDSPEAKAALSELCTAYYAPVFGFVRRNAPDEESAWDLTQEFFRRLLAGHGVEGVEPSLGRFRSFLLGAVKHFLTDMRKHDQRLKRGAGQPLDPSRQALTLLRDCNCPTPPHPIQSTSSIASGPSHYSTVPCGLLPGNRSVEVEPHNSKLSSHG